MKFARHSSARSLAKFKYKVFRDRKKYDRKAQKSIDKDKE